tara:strand:+ start:6903 stop:7415 length:513 start_codon:yes stop_codon:yes gene_type:complete
MTLVVEDGTGLTNAESYASVSEADTYFTARSNPAAWSGLTDDDKERHLRLATQYLDLHYGGRWKGQRRLEEQALDWPRYDAEDRDGYDIDFDVVPVRLKHATIEAALRSVSDGLMPDLADPGAVKNSRVKVDVIEIATEYTSGNKPTPTYPIIDNLIFDLVYPGNAFIRA